MQQDGFTNHGTKLRKQLWPSFPAQSCSGRVGVKGQDERQTAPPLTPTRPLREISRRFTLTGADAVIHGIARISITHRQVILSEVLPNGAEGPAFQAIPSPLRFVIL